MLLALCSIIASLGVLAGSDRKPVDSWPTPPSTYLAILTALANLSIRYSACQGKQTTRILEMTSSETRADPVIHC